MKTLAKLRECRSLYGFHNDGREWKLENLFRLTLLKWLLKRQASTYVVAVEDEVFEMESVHKSSPPIS